MNYLKQQVYLAGGMKSGWQSKVKKITGFTFFDPREKETKKDMSVDEYGTWDLHFIKSSDIVFAYMEKTNPSGIGMSVEMGYARGLGKTVVLVLEADNKTIKDGYLQFLKKAASITFDNLPAGLAYLKSMRVKV